MTPHFPPDGFEDAPPTTAAERIAHQLRQENARLRSDLESQKSHIAWIHEVLSEDRAALIGIREELRCSGQCAAAYKCGAHDERMRVRDATT